MLKRHLIQTLKTMDIVSVNFEKLWQGIARKRSRIKLKR